MDTKMRILVVEDEPDVMKILKARLVYNKFDVIEAVTGEEALTKAKNEKPNLIVLDVNIPPPNGYNVCRTLKDDTDYKNIPIILLTARTAESDEFWGIEAGADSYMTKPYNANELLEKINELLEMTK